MFEKENEIAGHNPHFWDDRLEFQGLMPLLQRTFTTVRILEADDASVGRVFPEVEELCRFLQFGAGYFERKWPGLGDLRQVYLDFERIVRERVLETSRLFFQFAYVMTPEGRLRARAERPPHVFVFEKNWDNKEFKKEMHVTCSLDELRRLGYVDDEDELELEEALGDVQGAPVVSEQDHEPLDNNQRRCPAAGQGIGAAAEGGLCEILKQFGITKTERELVVGAFQWYMEAAPEKLPLKPGPGVAGSKKKSVYSWSAAPDEEGWRIVADIGLRLVPLVCSEAISERTNSQMRRFLSPYRMRMGKGVLLARMNIAKHGGRWAR
jgi:hypothetical protein